MAKAQQPPQLLDPHCKRTNMQPKKLSLLNVLLAAVILMTVAAVTAAPLGDSDDAGRFHSPLLVYIAS